MRYNIFHLVDRCPLGLLVSGISDLIVIDQNFIQLATVLLAMIIQAVAFDTGDNSYMTSYMKMSALHRCRLRGDM